MNDRQPRLLIKNGTLIDGSGSKAAPNSLIAVEGNRISHLGLAGAAMRPETPDDIVIDAAGKFILPGLIDAHCHISLHQGALPGARYTSRAEFCSCGRRMRSAAFCAPGSPASPFREANGLPM